jgi:hypothetical protein
MAGQVQAYADPYGNDAYDGQAEDDLNKLGNMPSRRLKDPVSCSDYVQTEGLGQEYSCDPSPFHERDADIAAAALAAANAARDAATAVTNMRAMLMKRAHDFHVAALAAAEDDDMSAHHGTPQAVRASVEHSRATMGRDLPIGDISTLLSPEAAALAGAITQSNQQRRLDAEAQESAVLASELGIDQGSDSSAGDDVDDDESSGGSELTSGDEGFIAPGDGADEATPMQDDEVSPPATIRTGRMRIRACIDGTPQSGQFSESRISSMPSLSGALTDDSSANDEMDSGLSDDATDLEVDREASKAALRLTAMLGDDIKGGSDPRHSGHFTFKDYYVVLDVTEGDQMLNRYFHGAESTWRYSSHAIVRGFVG